MPLDLSSIEGLNDEQKASIASLHDAAVVVAVESEVDGLKTKNAELIQREKDAKTKADTEENARLEAEEQARIDLAEQNKDFEGLKQALADKDARIAEQDKATKDFAENQVMATSRNEFMKLVSDDPAAQHYMESQFNSSVGVRDGQAVPVNADGGVTGQSLTELVASIQANESNAKYMRSNAGSGGSANGSGNPNGGSADISKMSKTEQSVYFNEHPEKAAQYFNQ